MTLTRHWKLHHDSLSKTDQKCEEGRNPYQNLKYRRKSHRNDDDDDDDDDLANASVEGLESGGMSSMLYMR